MGNSSLESEVASQPIDEPRELIKEFNEKFKSKKEYFSESEIISYKAGLDPISKRERAKVNINEIDIRNSIGVGKTAEVYLGKCRETEKDIAIKVFKLPFSNGEERERIKKEIIFQMHFLHKNLIEYYGCKVKLYNNEQMLGRLINQTMRSNSEHEIYGFEIYMEYMDENSMEKYLKNQNRRNERFGSDISQQELKEHGNSFISNVTKPVLIERNEHFVFDTPEQELKGLDEPIVSNVIKQVLKGLEYMHHKGIVHRDIKPSNILLKKICQNHRNNDEIIVKLADYGSARLISPTMKSTQGTVTYMAPEVL